MVTDSGLGGLSVAANLFNNFKNNSPVENVKIVFFNSLAHPDYGYNAMPDLKTKADVFNSALLSMKQLYNPDIILIACNTLSVVYPFTGFSKNGGTAVTGIVEFGIKIIAEKLSAGKNSSAILFGTETTIKGNAHKEGLVNLGIDEKKIIPQACSMLETEIQKNPSSGETERLINKYVNEALTKIQNHTEHVYAALCCTHYEYSIPLFRKVFEEKNLSFTIVNPNEKMSAFLFDDNKTVPAKNKKLEAAVISKCRLRESDLENIGSCIKNISMEFAAALENYKYEPELFYAKLPASL